MKQRYKISDPNDPYYVRVIKNPSDEELEFWKKKGFTVEQAPVPATQPVTPKVEDLLPEIVDGRMKALSLDTLRKLGTLQTRLSEQELKLETWRENCVTNMKLVAALNAKVKQLNQLFLVILGMILLLVLACAWYWRTQ